MASTGGGAWAFHPHLVAWVLAAALAGGYLWATRTGPVRTTARQRWCFVSGCALLALALGWPLADLAARWSLSALVLQRLLLMLTVPALLLVGSGEALLVRLTRPAPVDTVVRWVSRPVAAVVIVTVIAVGTLTTGAVQLQSDSALGRGGLDLALLMAGFVLWLPFLAGVPGSRPLSALGRAAYLLVQSIVPSFLSIVWIFARHPLYPPFAHRAALGGLSPLLDQQIAGFVAKLATIAVLWTVAFVSLSRTTLGESGEAEHRLTWADVERQLLRIERRERRQGEPPPSDPVVGGRPEEGGPPGWA